MAKIHKVYDLPETIVEGDIYIYKKDQRQNVSVYIGKTDGTLRSVSTTEAKNIHIKNDKFPNCETLEDVINDIDNKLSFPDTKEFINFWSGSKKSYQKIAFPDPNVLYFIYSPTGFTIDTSLVNDTTSFKMPLYGDELDILVTWGDETIDRITYGSVDYFQGNAKYNGTWYKNENPIHTYAKDDVYTINIEGYLPKFSFYEAYTEAEREIYPQMLIEVSSLDNIGLTSLTKAFYDCQNLRYVCDMPVNYNFTDMDETFYRCINLTSVGALPKSLTSMNSTFKTCYYLNQQITVPEGVTELSHTFENCEHLTIFPTILSNATKFDYAFSNCGFESLAKINLPYSLVEAPYAFAFCRHLIDTPIIGMGVENCEGMFSCCADLKTITNIPITLKNGKKMFNGCLSLNRAIPDFPYYIEDISEMYMNCVKLTGNVPYFPASVKKCKRTFYGCIGLDGYAEDNWTYKNPNFISKSDGTYNCYQCFLGCTNLKNYYYNYELNGKTYPKIWRGATSIDEDAEGWCGNNQPIIVLEFEDYVGYTCQKLGDMAIINFGDGTEDITLKTGDFTDYTYYAPGNYVVTLRLPNDVKSVSARDALIHYDDFNNDSCLKKIYSLNLLWTFGKGSSLFNGSGVTYVHPNVFNNEWLEHQNYTQDNLGIATFKDCTDLTSAEITIPKKITSTNSMFNGCTNLTKTLKIIPNTVTDASSMFNDCVRLKDLPIIELGGTKPLNLYACFRGAGNIIQGKFSISHITIPKNANNCYDMFSACTQISNLPMFELGYIKDENGEIIRLNTRGMFWKCHNLEAISKTTFPSRIIDATYMFQDCIWVTKITSRFENDEVLDYNESYTPNILNDKEDKMVLRGMFFGCNKLKDASEFVIPKNNRFVLNSMFSNCTSLINSPKMHTECNALSFRALFDYNKNLSVLNFDDIPTTAVDYSYMFRNCHSLTKAPWFRNDTFDNSAKYTIDCQYMFTICKVLTGFIKDYTQLKVPINTKYNGCFEACPKLTEALKFNISEKFYNYMEIGSMYGGCSSLKNISHIVIPASASYCAGMFGSTGNLIDFVQFEDQDYAKGRDRNFSKMFENAYKNTTNFDGIVPETFIFPKLVNRLNCDSMFKGCTAIKDMSHFEINYHADNINSMFRDCVNLAKYPFFDITDAGYNLQADSTFMGCSSAINGDLDLSNVVFPHRISYVTSCFAEIPKAFLKMPKIHLSNHNTTACSFYATFSYTISGDNKGFLIDDDIVLPRKISSLNDTFRGRYFSPGKKVTFAPEGIEEHPSNSFHTISVKYLNNTFMGNDDFDFDTFDLDGFDSINDQNFTMNSTYSVNSDASKETKRTIILQKAGVVKKIRIPSKVTELIHTFYGCVSNAVLQSRSIFEIPDDNEITKISSITRKNEMIDMFGANIDMSILAKCHKLKELVINDENVINIAIDPNAPITLLNISGCGFTYEVLNDFLLTLPPRTDQPQLNLTGYEDTIGLEEETITQVKDNGWVIIS